MRLDKFLVDCGVGSRTEVKQLLKQKKIAVNGKKETTGKLQIDPDKDQVTFMGEDLVHETFVYYRSINQRGSSQRQKMITTKLC